MKKLTRKNAGKGSSSQKRKPARKPESAGAKHESGAADAAPQKRTKSGNHVLKFGGTDAQFPRRASNNSRQTGSKSSKGPKKKLLIKPFKVQPKPAQEFEDQALGNLNLAVTAIYQKKGVQQSLEELYRSVESLCIHKRAPESFRRLKEQCDQHVSSILQTLAGLVASRDPVEFLNDMNSAWAAHRQEVFTIRGLYLYLERTHVIHDPETRSIWDMGLMFFRRYFLKHVQVKEGTTKGLLVLIQRQRLGELVPREIIKTLLRMLISLGLYKDGFETRFMEASGTFYRVEAARNIQDRSLFHYLAHVKKRLREEEERASQDLDGSSREGLMRLARHHLIYSHTASMLNKAFAEPLASGPDFTAMYTYFGSVDALPQLKDALEAYCKNTGSRIVEDGLQPEAIKGHSMVEGLLHLKTTVDQLLQASFQRNSAFKSAIKTSFEHVINEKENKPAELVAKFLHKKLHTGSKDTEEELEKLLEQIMCLFRFIQEKDLFLAFYKKDLAKRLLLNKSANQQAELAMIAKLKTECGANFTSKLEGMFKDMALSGDVMKDFNQQQPSEMPFDLNVQVLTTGSWPSYPETPLKLPRLVAAAQETFKAYYLGKNSGRKLVWVNQLGTCVLRANFPKGRKELAVSGAQATVLMLFNSKPSAVLNFSQIKELSGLAADELKLVLRSLACSKGVNPLLKKPSKSREVKPTDMFKVNQQLQHKLIRIKINRLQAQETKEEQKRTTSRVFQDRQYAVDAAVVRIMKSRKTLSHALLMAEVVKQLTGKFAPSFAEVKKRIGSLLEREYIERDPDNPQTYNYVA